MRKDGKKKNYFGTCKNSDRWQVWVGPKKGQKSQESLGKLTFDLPGSKFSGVRFLWLLAPGE